MKIIAVTACPTGIAHTYMAAEALKRAAPSLGLKIRVETQGAMGIEDPLTPQDIAGADLVLIVSDITIEQPERFRASLVHFVSIESVLKDAGDVLKQCLSSRRQTK